MKKVFVRCMTAAIILAVMMAGGIFFKSRTVSAAGASISIKTKNNTVAVGDTVYVVITVSSSDVISGFEGYFTYDSSVLKYITGGSVISGNDDEFLITDTGREEASNKVKYSIKFLARKYGSVTIDLKAPYGVYDSENAEMSVSYSPLSIMVKKKSEADSSKPQKAQTEIKDTPQPSPSAEPENPKEEEPTQEPSQEKSKKDKKNSNSNGINGMKVSLEKGNIVFHLDTSYTVTEPESKEMIPDGFRASEMKISGKLITMYKPDSDYDGECMLVYCRKGKEEPDFYVYDKKAKTMMPYHSVKSFYDTVNGVQNDSNSGDDVLKYRYFIGIITLSFLLIFIIMAAIISHLRKK